MMIIIIILIIIETIPYKTMRVNQITVQAVGRVWCDRKGQRVIVNAAIYNSEHCELTERGKVAFYFCRNLFFWTGYAVSRRTPLLHRQKMTSLITSTEAQVNNISFIVVYGSMASGCCLSSYALMTVIKLTASYVKKYE